MKNIAYALLIIVLAFISCFITMKLTEMRVDSLEERVKGIEYDVETHKHIIDEILE